MTTKQELQKQIGGELWAPIENIFSQELEEMNAPLRSQIKDLQEQSIAEARLFDSQKTEHAQEIEAANTALKAMEDLKTTSVLELDLSNAKVKELESSIEEISGEGLIMKKRISECLGMAAQLRKGLDQLDDSPDKLLELKQALDKILNFAQTPELERQLAELEMVQKEASEKAAALRLLISQ